MIFCNLLAAAPFATDASARTRTAYEALERDLVGVLLRKQRLEGELQRLAGGGGGAAAKKLANQRRRRAVEVQLADLDREASGIRTKLRERPTTA